MVKALVAIGALVLLVVGPPLGLVQLGDPLPGRAPSWQQVQLFFGGADVGTVLIKVGLALAWGLWVVLAICVLVEVVARARGHEHHLRRPGPRTLIQQLVLAASLSGVVMTHLPTPASFVATAAVTKVMPSDKPVGNPAVVAQASPARALAETTVSIAAAPGADAHSSTYTVKKHDSLWRIAGELYGDNLAWHVLADANPWITDPHWIYPGTVLRVPLVPSAAAVHPTSVSPATAEPANHTGATPSSSKARDAAKATAPVTPADVTLARAHNGVAYHRGAAAGASTALFGSSQPSTASSPAEHTPVMNGSSQHESPQHASEIDHMVLPAGLAGAGLLAAGVWMTLARRRRRQMRRCAPGRRPPQPPPRLVPAAAALRQGAKRDLAQRLEAAVDVLATGLAARRGAAPLVVGVLVSRNTLVFHLSEVDDAPPEPFRASEDGLSWALPAGVPLEPRDEAEVILPALVSVGTTAMGEQVLVNLEAFGAISLSGGGAPALMRAWVLELVTRRWSDCLEVATVGFGAELETMERIRVVEDLPATVAALATQGRQVSELVDGVGEVGLTGARLQGQGDTWSPTVLFCMEAPPTSVLGPLRNVLADSARSGIAVVGIGTLADAVLELDTDAERMDIGSLGVVVRPNRVSTEEFGDVGELLSVADSEDDVADSDAPYDTLEVSVLAVEKGMQGVLMEVSRPQGDGIEVGVLGPVRVEGKVVTPTKAMELIAYLALNPSGASMRRLWDALYPGEDRQMEKTLRNIASLARKALGAGPDGDEYVSRRNAGRYVLHPSVGTDWARFCELVVAAHADGAGGLSLLEEALGLVRGMPFEGAGQGRQRGYGWVETTLATEMELRVVETACELAEMAMASDDDALARWAVHQGMLATRDNEQMYAMAMRVAHGSGDKAAVEATMDELCQRVDYEDLGEEVMATYDQLRGAVRAPARV